VRKAGMCAHIDPFFLPGFLEVEKIGDGSGRVDFLCMLSEFGICAHRDIGQHGVELQVSISHLYLRSFSSIQQPPRGSA
jgi:hypothetical protein